jgi:hypothetical protein
LQNLKITSGAVLENHLKFSYDYSIATGQIEEVLGIINL